MILLIFGRFLGNYGASLLSITSLSILLVLLFSVFDIVLRSNFIEIYFGSWIDCSIGFDWIIIFDHLSLEMSVLVVFITLLVVIYSVGYMSDDPHYIRFLAYLMLFATCMLVLVSAGNLLQLFIGWEGVGLASFLLVNFWYTRLEANRSAIKAILFNRIGDIGFMFALVLLIKEFKTVNIYEILTISTSSDSFLDNRGYIFELIGFFFFVGAMGKSAQIGLHAWLADAMEGPTPVSALLHSATMVTAGVFLLLRLYPFLEKLDLVISLILIIGSLTALMGSSIAIFQNDIKKIIAYSTCSQLGFMMVAIGSLNATGCFFHLMTHAFFKALLFLTAGSVIHSLFNEQDIRKMGGIYEYLPVTSLAMLIGSISLTGFPFLSGFFSKESVIFFSYTSDSFLVKFSFICIFISSIFTGLYTFRMLYLVFWSKYRGFKYYLSSISEPNIFMMLPIVILSFLAIFFGYFFDDFFIGISNSNWFGIFNFDYTRYEPFRILEQEKANLFLKVFLSFLPITLFFYFQFIYPRTSLFKYYLTKKFVFSEKEEISLTTGFFFRTKKAFNLILQRLYYFFSDKWFFSSLYRLFHKNFMTLSYNFLIKNLDRGFLESLQNKFVLFFYNFSLVFSFSRKNQSLYDFFFFFFLGLFSFFIFIFFL